MRWARERDLPVRRMPGGKQGSVFCFEQELAAWALHQDDDEDRGEAATVPSDVSAPPLLPSLAEEAAIARLGRPPRWAIAAGLIVLAMLVAAWFWWDARPGLAHRTVAMPENPAVARDYVAARDHWARRTRADLETAIHLYEGVIRRDPGFAPAYAGLAEAWLIIGEYGGVVEADAFRRARHYASTALRLDPELPAAYRALGFVDYWWRSDRAGALAEFRRAIALDDRDGQTYFWYANMLADIGDDPAAQAAYDRARLLSPGLLTIEVEQACAHWQAGRDALAYAQLTALAARAPNDATIHNCLAFIHIGHGDIIGYARELAIRARLRGEPRLQRLSAALDAAIRRDPKTAVTVLTDHGRQEIARGERKLRETPAFYASSMGDRAALIALLREANDQDERWYATSLTRRIARRWRGDAQVERLLAGVLPPEKRPKS
ncbi:tetratricopeptide (TPR) repeat protein [Sphingomonas sp. 1185]